MPPKDIKPTPADEKPLDRSEDRRTEDKPSPVEKVRADVEKETNPLAAVMALITGQAAAFKVAVELGDVEAHEVASQFEARAQVLAENVIRGLEAEWAKIEGSRGGNTAEGAGTGGVAAAEREQPSGLRSPMAPAATLQEAAPHNAHAVERAVEHGMDPGLAHQMTTHGSNS